MDLKEEGALGEAIGEHWYYVSKARMIETHIQVRNVRILDVGAGSGWFSRWLLENGIAAEAICVDPGYAEEKVEQVNGRPLTFRRTAGGEHTDLVLLMDVLEHVDDDAALLSAYVDSTPPDAAFLITVPAFQWLWSAHDDYLGHRRRYTIETLTTAVSRSRLTIVAAHYYFASILLPAIVVRLIGRFRKADRSDMKPAPGWLNRLLLALLTFERRWMRTNRMAGLSVVMLCRKQLAGDASQPAVDIPAASRLALP